MKRWQQLEIREKQRKLISSYIFFFIFVSGPVLWVVYIILLTDWCIVWYLCEDYCKTMQGNTNKTVRILARVKYLVLMLLLISVSCFLLYGYAIALKGMFTHGSTEK